MSVRPDEFLRFVASNYALVKRLCLERVRFVSDEAIASFLGGAGREANPSRAISTMKELGILVRGADGEWAAPPYLIRFVREIHQRQRLASPAVVNGWVESLAACVRRTEAAVDGQAAAEDVLDLLDESIDTFDAVVHTVDDNCRRISSEVAEYRRAEDGGRMRARLRRLCKLYDDYLIPLVSIVEVGGPFHSVTEDLLALCSRLESVSGLGERAALVALEVRRVRRQSLASASASHRELEPLRRAAARESRISKGVNRALDAANRSDWVALSIPDVFPLVEERDSGLFEDDLVERFLAAVSEGVGRTPPTFELDEPAQLEDPVDVSELLAQLEAGEDVEDLFGWILARVRPTELAESSTHGGADADRALRTFQTVLAAAGSNAVATEELLAYRAGAIGIEATRWQWRS